MNTVNLRAPIAKAFAFIAVRNGNCARGPPAVSIHRKAEIFDVASVKPCVRSPRQPRRSERRDHRPRNGVAYNCLTLLSYIRQSYAMNAGGQQNLRGALIKIKGGPSWINSDLYQISRQSRRRSRRRRAGCAHDAVAPRRPVQPGKSTARPERSWSTPLGGGQRRPQASARQSGMPLRRRLAFRPPWKAGEKPPPPTACKYGIRKPDGVEVLGSAIADFCLALNVRIPLGLDRMIVDKTGIQGQYDFDLKWSPEDVALALSAWLPLPFPSRHPIISPSSIAPCAASAFVSNPPKAPASSSSSIMPIILRRTNSCFPGSLLQDS